MEKTNDARFRNGYENRARLADMVTDDLIEQIENGAYENREEIKADFEILKWLWDYELRSKLGALNTQTEPEPEKDEEEERIEFEPSPRIKAALRTVLNTGLDILEAEKK